MVILAPPGFPCRDVKAGGNCMFRAISHFILGSSDRHAGVRRQVVKTMEEEGRREEFKALCVRDEDIPPNRASNAGEAHFRSYVKKMGKPGTWGDELCLLAASMSYKKAIKVWNSHAQRWWNFGDQWAGEGSEICIARDPEQNAEHYVALERNPAQKKRAHSCGEPQTSKASRREKEPAPAPRKGATGCP